MARGVIYLHRTGIDIFVPSIGTIVQVLFPVTSVKDMDVINEDQAHAAIKSVLDAKKIIPPMSYLIVLADDTLFMRDFPSSVPVIPRVGAPTQAPGTPAPVLNLPAAKAADLVNQKNFLHEQDIAIQAFIDRVPFESVSSKTVNTDASKRVIVTNKELFMVVKNAFVKSGFVIDAVVPGIVFQKLVNLSAGFTPVVATSLLTQNEIIKQNDLMIENTATRKMMVDAKTGKEMPTKTRAFILIGIFIFLFIVMAVMYYMLYMKPQPAPITPTKTKKSAVKSKVTIIPTSPVASSSATDFSSLNVQIRSSVSTASQAARIRALLSPIGITNITTSTSSLTVSRTLVTFSSDVTQAVRNQIFTQVSTVFPTASSQESGEGSKTVSIILGR